MNKIYALLDIDTLNRFNISIKDFCLASKKLNASILQYRDKNSSLEEKEKRIKEIKKYWDKTLIINDNIELLHLADGIHIGQEDLENLSKKFNLSKPEIIKALKNGKWKMENGEFKFSNSQFSTLNSQFIVGLSTHNEKEILEANKFPLSYIGLGAYRKTSTKDTSNILGEKIVELIKLSLHPVAVIGGIKLSDEIEGATYKVIASDICKNINLI